MTRRSRSLLAGFAAAAVLVAACGDDDDETTSTTQAEAPTTAAGTTPVTAAPGTTATTADTTGDTTDETTADTTDDTTADTTDETTAETTDDTTAQTEPAGEQWTVDVENCPDPDEATASIEGTVKIGSVAPLSGGPATAFAPVTDGYNAYIEYANQNELVPGYTLELTIADDQFNKDITPTAVNDLLDQGVHVVSGIIGSASNFAVRDLLNEECVPQLNSFNGSPIFSDATDYPWSFIVQIPYDIESKAYLATMQEMSPDGATVALFYANSETGIIYRDAFDEFAGDYGIDIVTEQTIEAADSAPPTAQVNAIAAEQPDYIMTVPVGAGCVAFLNELANAKAANPGWEPAVFLSSTCASQLILAAAGPAADDLYTSPTGALKDVGNPEVQANDEQVAEYVAFMTEQGKEATITSGAAGWLVMELTVEMIRQAVESPDGLSRKSIIEVARNIEYTPSLVREGITFAMSGEEDPYLSDTVQVLQFDAETATFTEVGEPVRPDEED